MKVKLQAFGEYLGASYWFIPSIMALGALVLGLLMPEIDHRLGRSTNDQYYWIYGGGTSGARSILETIASSVIGVAGVAFSITIVTFVLAASQFGPRLLRNFIRDKGNKMVLGVFLATFLYCLMVLRSVRGTEMEWLEGFVPFLSITLGVFFALASLGFLIYFIHHVVEMIQAPVVLAAVSDDLHDSIEKLFPEELGEKFTESEEATDLEREFEAGFERDSVAIEAWESGYIQRIDAEGIINLARKHDMAIKIDSRPGQFITRGDDIFKLRPKDKIDENIVGKLKAAFEIGKQRTQAQDVLFSINQLVEVAVRALSPSLNDPFTAMQCLDWLGEALIRLAGREIPSPYRSDKEGRLRVVAPAVTFEDLTNSAFNMIRQYGKDSASVMTSLVNTIGEVLSQAHRQADREVLLKHATLAYHQARETLKIPVDFQRLEDRYHAVLRAYRSDVNIHENRPIQKKIKTHVPS